MLSKLFFMDNASISNGTKFLKNSKIEIYSNEVLLNSSNIIGTSFGDVSGSDIYIKGDILTLQGENLDPTFSYKGSFINTQATTTGKAGDIYINMNEITLKNSARVDTLSAGSNASGDAGDIKIECQDLNILGNSGILTISYIGAGGGIDIDISNRLYMQNSNILTSVYKENSNGGDITIKEPKYVILNSSKVKANTFEGRGGDISFKAKYFINSIDSNIEAKAISNRGVDGDINNDSLSVDISKLLTRDRFEFANEPYQLSSCSNRGSINSISINGRDSSYMRYDDLLPSQVGYY
jgi:hypothetical protein